MHPAGASVRRATPEIAFAIGTAIAAGKRRAWFTWRLPVQKDIDEASGDLVPARCEISSARPSFGLMLRYDQGLWVCCVE
jgi:hypothetical protein